MNNIALILGASDYTNLTSLPACLNDCSALKKIFDASSKFKEVKIIINKSSIDAKKEISDFILKYKNSSVDEFVYYFSGHGDYDGKDFFYLLSDYNSRNPNSTSFSNTEFDSMLKSLNPKLTVKIVDACKSGVAYIKDNDSIEQYLKGTKEQFNNCYFMFSSQSHENSSATKDWSFFTKALVDSILSYSGEELRYPDLISSIADSFLNNDQQKPFFITQAEHTEIFLNKIPLIKEIMQKDSIIEKIVEKDESDELDASKNSIVDIIIAESKNYLSEKEVFDNLDKISEYLERSFLIKDDLEKLFDFNLIIKNNYDDIYDKRLIGIWLRDNFKYKIFANTTTRVESYQKEVPVNSYKNNLLGSAFAFSQSLLPQETKTVTSNRTVVDGFDINADVNYKSISLKANPKFNNLCMYECQIVFLFSKKDYFLFYKFIELQEYTFGKWDSNTHTKWLIEIIPFNSLAEIFRGYDKVIIDFHKYILSELEKTIESDI